MTARTFGRRVVDEAAVAARRAAFVAGEAGRADRIARSEISAVPDAPVRPRPEPVPPPPEPVFVGGKSLTAAYALWLGLGLAGGHRFYLRRPRSGAVQALLFVASWGLAAAEYYAAFFGLVTGALWMLADGFLIRRMHRQATWR